MSTPTILGDRYELRGVLGRGGMAEVRDGWDTRLGRAVAIKLLHPTSSASSDGRLRFEAEARAAAALSHPNIVSVHDYGEHDGTPFIVMERLPGTTLADQIAQAPLSPPHVRVVMDAVLDALAAAHRAGMLHRDIKPGNILFTAEGNVKVADFGIAKTTDNDYTQSGQIVGTLAYLSPDRLHGRPAAVTDDLYAVGCVGYEALTGRRAFPEETLGALTRSILDDTPPPLLSLRPDADPALVTVIERAMSRLPQERFGEAEAMRTALRNPMPPPPSAPRRPGTMVMTAPFPAAPPSGVYVPSSAGATPRRRGAKIAAVAVIIGAFLLAAVLLVVNSPFDGPADTAPATSSTLPATTVTSSPATMVPVTTAPAPPLPGDQPGPPGNGKEKGNNGKGKKERLLDTNEGWID